MEKENEGATGSPRFTWKKNAVKMERERERERETERQRESVLECCWFH